MVGGELIVGWNGKNEPSENRTVAGFPAIGQNR